MVSRNNEMVNILMVAVPLPQNALDSWPLGTAALGDVGGDRVVLSGHMMSDLGVCRRHWGAGSQAPGPLAC